VLALHRVFVGPISVEGLEVEQSRLLTKNELAAIEAHKFL